MSDEDMPRCIVSDPAQPHYLSRRAGYKIQHECFACGKNSVVDENIKPNEENFVLKIVERNRAFHYYCTNCDQEFHAGCVQFPSKMIHPYHPQHPLTFTFLNYETEITANTNYGEFFSFLFSSGFKLSEFLKSIVSKPNIIFDKCTWCRNDLGQWFYLCSICNFSLDIPCAIKIPPLTIQNPKSHHHPLTLFPRPLSFPCDACGLINLLEPSYACYQCNYMVHQSCINLPRVIKITRHPHRLSHAPFLPTKVSLCRVCYKNVDIKYGQYSCNQEDCSYVVHSKCATHTRIWDGKELEWEPEEPDDTENIAPFKKVGDNLIEHFCHRQHYLKLEKYDNIRDSGKQCEACIRPIRSHDFYNCVECDFFLHKVCANLPQKLDHALHKHPLFLRPYSRYDMYNELSCSICTRLSSGFKYKCGVRECKVNKPFEVDVNCILVPECFTHRIHEEHPLFISTCFNANDEVRCHSGKGSFHGDHLHCTLCDFALCYKCATVPKEIYYKHAELPLALCYGKSGVNDIYWCEICEKKIDPKEWFYTNDDGCCITIHRECLFGDSAYMKSGHKFDYYFGKVVEVVSNGSCSRPICCICHRHCPDHVCFTLNQKDFIEVYICSFSCLREAIQLRVSK